MREAVRAAEERAVAAEALLGQVLSSMHSSTMNIRIAHVNVCASLADLGQARKDIMNAASVQVYSAIAIHAYTKLQHMPFLASAHTTALQLHGEV